MATGDLQNSIRRLQTELKACKYTGDTDVRGLISGSPSALLPLLHYSLLSFSYPLAVHLSDRGYDLYGKSDSRFVDTLYKLLRDEFDHTPRLTKAQLLTAAGFAEHKSLLVCRVLKLCRERHALLTKKGGSVLVASKPKTVAALGRSRQLASENGARKTAKSSATSKGAEKNRSPLQSVINSQSNPIPHDKQLTGETCEEDLVEGATPELAFARQPILPQVAAPFRDSAAHSSHNSGVLASAHAILSSYPGNCLSTDEANYGDQEVEEALPTFKPVMSEAEPSSMSGLPAEHLRTSHRFSHEDPQHRHPPPAMPSSYAPLSHPLPNSSRYLHNDDASAFPTRTPATFPVTSHLRQSKAKSAPLSDCDDAPVPETSAPLPSVSVVRSRFSPPRQHQSSHISSLHRASEPARSDDRPTISHAAPLPPLHHTQLGAVSKSGVTARPNREDPGELYSRPAPGMSSNRALLQEQHAHAPQAHAYPSSSSTAGTHYPPNTMHEPQQQAAQSMPMQAEYRHTQQSVLSNAAQHPAAAAYQPTAAAVRSREGILASASSIQTSSASTLQSAGSALSLADSGSASHPASNQQAPPELNQVMLQMNAMSAQIGFVSTQLSQLLLADHSRPPAAARPMQIAASESVLPGTALSQSSTSSSTAVVVPAAGAGNVGHALETIEARLVLMETRMHRLEQTPTTTPNVAAAIAPVTTAAATAGMVDRSIEWHTSATATEAARLPGRQPLSSASSVMPQRPQDISISQSTIARSITVQQSPFPQHRSQQAQLNQSTTVSTVDISYVFSDPSTQAFVSGLKNRVKETRRVLTNMSPDGDADSVSSSLQQQFLLAATSTGAPSVTSMQ
eukprot:scpid10938/ scgid28674/ Centrosomal protein of 44 kDa